MKISKIIIAAVAGIFAVSLSPVFGEAKDNVQTEYSSDCKALAAYYDPEIMAKTMANPAEFMKLFVEMNKPETMQAFMECSSNPEQWNVWVANYSNPTKWMNSMVPFMNPATYMNWMAASMNPQMYQPFFAYMNPAFYSQWMAASMNPEFYGSMFKMMYPNAYTKAFESFYQFPVVAQANAE